MYSPSFRGHFKRHRDRLGQVNALADAGDAEAPLDDGDIPVLARLQLNLQTLDDAVAMQVEVVALQVAAMVGLLVSQIRSRERQPLKGVEPTEDGILFHETRSSNSMVKVTWAGISLVTI